MGFAEALRSARQKANMTQQQLADAVGVSRVSITAFETGRRRNPSPEIREALSRVLGVEPSYLQPSNFVEIDPDHLRRMSEQSEDRRPLYERCFIGEDLADDANFNSIMRAYRAMSWHGRSTATSIIERLADMDLMYREKIQEMDQSNITQRERDTWIAKRVFEMQEEARKKREEGKE